MLMRNERAILVAAAAPQEAYNLQRLLRQMGYLARMAPTPGQVLEVMRREMVDQAIVAIELTLAQEPILARLARLPCVQHLIATGPAGNVDMETRARCAGAHVYLPRPAEIEALAMAFNMSLAGKPP